VQNKGMNRARGRGGNRNLVPIYYRLQNDLRENIENGKWIPGKAIPPAQKIANDYGISLGTAHKAILNLVTEGYLYRIQGVGTFVAGTTIRRESLRYIRMRENFLTDDITYHIRLIDLEVARGIPLINDYLKISADENLFRLKRVFISHSNPIAYTISSLPCKLFKKFKERVIPLLEKMTLYECIEQEYGMPTISNHELFGISQADQKLAETLGVEIGSPVLTVEMLSFTYKGRPYEYRISYFNIGDQKLFRELM
jgi:GntR family transcriptional regulator